MVNGRSTAKNAETTSSEFQKIDFASKPNVDASLNQNDAAVNLSQRYKSVKVSPISFAKDSSKMGLQTARTAK